MIQAFCNQCGELIDPKFAAGVRFLIGKQEFSGHLCPEHQAKIKGDIEEYAETHSWREGSKAAIA